MMCEWRENHHGGASRRMKQNESVLWGNKWVGACTGLGSKVNLRARSHFHIGPLKSSLATSWLAPPIFGDDVDRLTKRSCLHEGKDPILRVGDCAGALGSTPPRYNHVSTSCLVCPTTLDFDETRHICWRRSWGVGEAECEQCWRVLPSGSFLTIYFCSLSLNL